MAENKKTIHEKLANIQQKLSVPKNQKNTFGNYMYRSCEDILEAVKPLLGDFHLTISDEVELIGDRYYVKATAYLSDGAETLKSSAYARESLEKKGMDAAQVSGAASSYARKYALNGLFCIDDTKDADTKDNNGASKITTSDSLGYIPRVVVEERSKGSTYMLDIRRKQFFAVCNELGLESEKAKEYVKDFYGAESFNDLTLEQLAATIASMRKLTGESLAKVKRKVNGEESVSPDEVEAGLDPMSVFDGGVE